ncbi:Flagellar basal body rod protein FlgB [Chlamydiales bacterium SCGC AG-110-M15]|nr:Flagellar basal body rod protein FlgB [Chlamydiales bacterium SCGC AG-110-M15]
MLSKLGHKNFTLLSKLLDLHSSRHRVHAQNIANVNTPNYRRREFKFNKALRNAMEGGTAAHYKSMQGWVDRPNNTPIRNNGNNVDIDMEMVSMQENSASYEIYSQLYTKRSQAVRSAIKGGM